LSGFGGVDLLPLAAEPEPEDGAGALCGLTDAVTSKSARLNPSKRLAVKINRPRVRLEKNLFRALLLAIHM
jgi:hypothetical protein